MLMAVGQSVLRPPNSPPSPPAPPTTLPVYPDKLPDIRSKKNPKPSNNKRKTTEWTRRTSACRRQLNHHRCQTRSRYIIRRARLSSAT